MKYIKLISIFLIALLLFGPAVSATELVKEPIEVEPVKTYYDLSSKEKSLNTGYIKIDDNQIDKYTIEKIDTGYAISADLLLTDHNRELELSKEFLNTVPGFDGKKFFTHNFDSKGLYTGVTMHVIGKDDVIKVPVHFSTVVINGFSGYYTDTQTLSSGQNITVPAGADRVGVSVAGDVPEYKAIDYTGNTNTHPYEPFAWWKFNDGTGSQIIDYSGNEYHANLTGGTWGENSLYFDGDDYAVVSSTDFKFNQSFSVVIKMNSTTTTLGQIVGCGDTFVGAARELGWAIGDRGDQSRIYCSYTNETDGNVLISDSYSIDRNTEYQIAVVYNNTSTINNFQIFRDGVLINTLSAPSPIIYGERATPWYLVIGKKTHTDASFYTGHIADIQIFTDVLTASQVSVMNVGFSGIQINNQPYNSSTLTLPENTTTIEYIATDDVDREVTVEAWYTEDIIIIDEYTDSDDYYYLNISHTAVESMSDGSIEYDTGKGDLTGITMSSNKGGAAFNVSDSVITIHTGATTEAETYYYNFTLPSWTVSGNVYLNGNGVALEGATIKLNGIGTTITDSTGAWNFTNVPNGIYPLSATMSGYQGFHANLGVSGEDRTDIELRLNAFGLDEERPDFYTLIVIASILLFLMFYYERRAICYLASFMALLTMLYIYSFSVFTFLAVMQMTLFALIALIGAVKGTTSREM